MPVTACDVKRWIKEGRISPAEGTTMWQPGWPAHRPVWRGTIDGWAVEFCPRGREIDITTLRVRALPVERAI